MHTIEGGYLKDRPTHHEKTEARTGKEWEAEVPTCCRGALLKTWDQLT